MTHQITIQKLNEVYIRVECEPHIAHELYEHFSFYIPNHRFHPKVKARVWDGRLHLFNVRERTLYAGLYKELLQYFKDNNYSYKNIDNEYYGRMDEETLIHYEDFVQYIKTLNITSHGKKIEPRDYQIASAFESIRSKRLVTISSTSSGKSLIIYIILRYLFDHDMIQKCLMIFPTTSLVTQIVNDFKDYSSINGFDIEQLCHKIYSGQDKKTNKPIVATTWQSIYKLSAQYYEQFDVVINDECHLCQSTSFVSILGNCRDVGYRFGFTGTLSSNNKVHRLVVQGLLGQAKQFTTSAELMEKGMVSDLKINCVMLGYSDETRKMMKKYSYAEEFAHICSHERRTKFITNLANDLNGNTIILFQRKQHGKEIYDILKQIGNKDVYYVDGDIDANIRENIRQELEQNDNAIVVASYGTSSTGWSVKNLHNGIFASPYKSEYKVLQSIGRGLRQHDSKSVFNLYDIVDDIQWKNRENYLLQHFTERVQYYAKESFEYKIVRINIE